MKRLPLLAALKTAAPALGDDDPLPALAHFCFADDSFYAYNDIVAVIVGLKTGLDLGLHGQTLLGVLGASRSEDIEFKPAKGVPGIMVTGSNVRMPTLSKRDFVFNLPAEDPLLSLTLSEDMRAALQTCLMSVTDDSMRPEYNGVTVRIGKTGTVLFSSDNITATRVSPPAAKVPARKEAALVLPRMACDLILKLFQDGAKPKMSIGEKVALVEFGGEPNVMLMTKLLGQPSMKLAQVFEEHAGAQVSWCGLPAGFAEAIEKARVLNSRDAVKECALIAHKGKLIVETAATLGTLHEELPITNAKLNVSVNVNPDFVARMLPFVGAFFINDNSSLVLGGGPDMSVGHIIAAIPKAAPAGEPHPRPQPAAAPKSVGAKTNTDFEDDDIPF